MNARVSTHPAGFTGFPDGTFEFLRGLGDNNEKSWFDAHRDDYQRYYVEPAKSLVEQLGPRLRQISRSVQFEPRINGSLFRVNRDVRFSRDKTPYKNHIDLWFWHGDRKGWDTPGFFFRMFHDRLILGVGMHRFEKETAKRYRDAVVKSKSGRALERALATVRDAGYGIGDPARKKVPRGYDPEHERAHLLRHDGLTAQIEAKVGKQARTPAFVDACTEHYAAMWPLGKWLLRETSSWSRASASCRPGAQHRGRRGSTRSRD